MGTLYITEYEYIYDGMGAEPALASQTVTIGDASQQSAAFSTTTQYIRLHSDTACSLAFGTDPTATPLLRRMAADQTEHFSVQPTHKVAVISNA